MALKKGSLEKNKELLRKFFKAFEEKKLHLLDELCGKDYTGHWESWGYGPDATEEVRGLENFKKAAGAFIEAMPDLCIVIEDLIAEGDKVVCRWKEMGTHTGAEFAGVPPTGKRIVWKAIGIYRIAKGKLAEEWLNEDSLGILKQLEAI
jgi:predicted ester cyclase